ncbi:MAG: PKD domain-containing protein [Saprospiraceae bacterium]|nr:gliding motility-associated C-terminal domain-containing protein [Lewinella sp.]
MNCFYSQKLLPGWRTWLALICALTISRAARAEGTRQVAPSPADSIVMLETNRPDFGNFAAYGGPDDSRLAVTIANPTEILYIGLSGEHNDEGRIFDLGRSRYRFRIVNQAGTVVHGPFLIDNSTANVKSWTNSQFGNYDVNATQNGFLIYQFAPGQAGDYYIQFEDVIGDGNSKVNIAFWDFTVTNNGQPIPGRIWSKNWAFRTPPMNTDQLPDCEWDRPFNGVLYSYTTDGFVSRIDFNDSGFQGLSFNVAFNSTGPGNTGNLERDRQSIAGFNATAFSAEHKIFLNEPDPVVFPDGECGTLEPAATFSCAGEGFCLEVTVSDPGQVEIVIDFNQNGVFDPDSQDVSLVHDFDPDNLTDCVPWNGLRGDSSAVAFGDTVDLLFTYTRGVQHYAVYDAEFLKKGFCVETIRPVCGQLNDNRLFWDDRGILDDSGTNQPKDGRGGCECGTDNCRTWTNFNINVDNCADRDDELTTGYGDKNTLNTWWFASSSLVTRADIPLLSCMIAGEQTICPGSTTELTVSVSGSFDTFTYSWSGPNGFTSTDASTGPLTVAGEYCVTVTNPVGCQRVCCEEVILGEVPTLNITVTDATCDAVTDGAIMATASGGSGQYEFSLNGGLVQDNGDFPALSSGEYVLVVQDLMGCADTLTVTVGTEDAIDLDYPDDLSICRGWSAGIDFTGSATGLSFSWEPTTGVSDPTSAKPTFSPEVTTTYTVTISKTGSPECFIQDVVEVIVSEDMNLQVSGMMSGCEAVTMLTASSDRPVNFTWLDMNGTEIGTGETITLPLSGTTTYKLRGEDADGCIQETEFTLTGGPVDVSLPDTLAVCLGEEVILEAINQDPDDQLTYSWTPTNLFAGGTNTASPDYIETPGVNNVFVTISNQFGCTYTDTVHIAVFDDNATFDFVSEVQCDGATVVFTNTSSGAFGFIWDFGDGTTSTEVSPTHVYGQGGTYTVQLTSIYDASCVGIKMMDVMVTEPEIVVDFPDAIFLCLGDSTTITFTGDPTGLSFSWEPTTGIDDPTSPNPTFSPTVSTTYTVTISTTTSPQCSIQDIVEITVSEDMNLQVSGMMSGCEPETTLTASGTGVVEYTWLDVNGDELGSGDTIRLPLSGNTTYILRGEDAQGCIQETPFTLMGGPVEVTLPDTLAVCFGEEVILEVTNQDENDQLTYSWTPTNLFAGGTDTASPDYIEMLGVNDVYVSISNQFGCTYMDTVHIAVFDANAMFDFESEVQCDGATVVFNNTSTGAFGFVWDFGDGTTSTEVNPTHVYGQEGTYTVQLTSIYEPSCISAKSMDVMVTEPEIVADFTYDLTECSSDSASITFTDASTNSMNNTVSWMWSFSDGQTSDEQNPTVTFNQSGEITAKLTITSDNGCMAMVTETIDIQLVDLNLPDGEINLCFGESVVLNPDGNPDYIYTWTPAAGLDDPTAASPTATPTQTTQYTVTALNIAGSDTCAVTAIVTVNVSAPINFDLGDDVTTCGEDVVVSYTADVPVTVQWTSANDGDLGTGMSITVNPLRRDTIFAVATDAAGCTDMDTLVIVDQGVDVVTDPEGPIMTCSDQEVMITIVNQDLMDQLTYSWSPVEYIISGADEATVTVVVVDGTVTFQAIVTNQFGCSDTVLVDVNAVPFNPNLPDTVFICPGTPMEINPDFVSGYSYQWSPAEGLDDPNASNPVFTGDQTTVYYVTVTDDSQTISCETMDSVVVFVYPDINLMTFGDDTTCEPTGASLSATTDVPTAMITWYDDPGLTNEIATVTPDQVVNINDPLPTGIHVFSAVAVDPATGCTDTSTVTIEVIDITNHLPPTAIDICSGDVTPLNPGGHPDLVYEWTPTDNLDLVTNGPHNPIFTGTDSMTYNLVVSDTLNGCSVELTVMVNVAPPINLTASGDTMLCMAVPIPLTASSDAANLTFAWYDNPDGIGDPVATGAEVMVTPPSGTTIYTVIATNSIGCTETDSVRVELTPIMAEITPPQVFCEPTEGITIMVTNLDPEVELTYQWAPAEAVDPDQGPIVTVDPAIATDYAVTVTNQEGCEMVLTTTVEIVDLSNLTITADPIDICLGESTTITVSGCEDCTYTWTGPGTIDPQDGPIVTVTPDEDGEVVYTVTVELNGCMETLSIPIKVTELICTSEYFFLPNAFTPNGDNINDELRVRSNFLEKITGFELQIFNRWGEPVFKTEDPLAAWDGTYKGKELPPDVYGFFMNVSCPTGEEVHTQGNISLLK